MIKRYCTLFLLLTGIIGSLPIQASLPAAPCSTPTPGPIPNPVPNSSLQQGSCPSSSSPSWGTTLFNTTLSTISATISTVTALKIGGGLLLSSAGVYAVWRYFNKELRKTNAALFRLQAEVHDMKTRMESRFDRVDQDIRQANMQLTDALSRINRTNQILDVHTTRLSTIDTRQVEHGTQLTGIQNQLTTIDQRTAQTHNLISASMANRFSQGNRFMPIGRFLNLGQN